MNINEKIKAVCPDCTLAALMKEYTTFRIGGPAKFLAKPKTVAELQNLLALCRAENLPYMMLGAGSNLLVADEGLDMVVIFTGEMNEITVENNTVYALAGASITALCRAAAEHSLDGLCFAFGIPGSVGGGVYMNAGAYGGEIKDVVSYVDAIDTSGNLMRLQASECDFAYRTSRFQQQNMAVVGAGFALKPGNKEEILAIMKDIIGRRKAKQPLEYPSAGSAFKRPQGAYASALIEQCGLKGFSVGDAQISEKHAGFIINAGDATCKDTRQLFAEVQRIVFEKTGFQLYPEVRFIP